MIKTIKEILFTKEQCPAIMIPAGTYLYQVGSRYYFQTPGLENNFIENVDVHIWKDYFVDVANDEPEVRKMFFDFSELLDRLDVQSIIETISKVEPEIVKKIRKFFGGEDTEKLHNKIKDLETRLFLEQLSSRPASQVYRTDGKVTYGSVCTCNPANGGDGICGCTVGNELEDPAVKTNCATTSNSFLFNNKDATTSTTFPVQEGTKISFVTETKKKKED